MKPSNIIYYRTLILLLSLNLSSPSFGTNSPEFDSLIVELSTTNVDTTKIFILLSLANAVNARDIKSLERFSVQALDLAQKTNYTRGLAYANYTLSKVYLHNEFDFAEKLLIKSLGFAEQLNDSILIAKVYNSIGILLLKDEGKEELALDYYYKSLDLFLNHGHNSETAAVYSNIGMVYEQDTMAITYFLRAAEINKKFENYLWLSINYLNIGITSLDLGNLEMGFDYLQKSLTLSEIHEFQNNIPDTYIALGEYYYLNANYDLSTTYAIQAVEKAREQTNRIAERDGLVLLKRIYSASKELEKALECSDRIMVVTDSIHRHNHLTQLSVLDMRKKFEEELKQKEIENKLLENKFKNQKFNLILIIISIGLLLVFFILLFYFLKGKMARNKLKEEQLSKELEFKKKELTTRVIYTLQKNDILSSLSKELAELKSNIAKEENRNSIDQISRKIKTFIRPDAWNEFEVRFHQVHLNFYKHLINEFPNLTQNEKRLCAFLRLNMSSKEISKLTGQSITAIEMARVRLRKKLGISNKKINLATFLSDF